MKRASLGRGGVIAIAVAIAVALGFVFEHEPQREKEMPLFPDLREKLATVDAITLGKNDERLNLAHHAEGWVIADKGGVPADGGAVQKFLLDLSRIERLEPRTADPALYDKLELGDAAAIVTLASDGKTVARLHVGKAASGGAGRRYVRAGEAPQTWVGAPVPDVKLGVRDWSRLKLPALSRERVKRVSLRHQDGDSIAVARAKPAEYGFRLQGLKKGEVAAYESVGDGLGASLAYLTYEDIRPASDIDAPPAVTARFETWDGLTVTLALTQLGDTWWAVPSAQYDPGVAAAPEAPAQMPDAAPDGKQEAADINALAAWAFALPDYKASELVKRRRDFLKDPQE
ncbi:MAG: DUF4340 domain-containing protein [Pseudomonadota bacterium]|jgi:hypothetical protein